MEEKLLVPVLSFRDKHIWEINVDLMLEQDKDVLCYVFFYHTMRSHKYACSENSFIF